MNGELRRPYERDQAARLRSSGPLLPPSLIWGDWRRRRRVRQLVARGALGAPERTAATRPVYGWLAREGLLRVAASLPTD